MDKKPELKLIPTGVKVDNLKFNSSPGQFGVETDKHITGSIIINFVSCGDFSQFVEETTAVNRINGLAELVAFKVLQREIIINA